MTQQPGREEVTKPYLLLVEGKDEEVFFAALLRKKMPEIASRCQIIAFGRDDFRRQLVGFAGVMGDAAKSLAVVRDADEDAARAFQSVCGALEAAGFAQPEAHGEVADGNPRVGVWVMPDGRNRGALEGLCRESVTETTAGACATDYLKCLEAEAGWGNGLPRNAAQRDKAFVHTYLASRREPMARTGEGAQQDAWDFDHPAFAALRDFLERLFAGPG